MLKFYEDAIKKDVEETLALRKDVEAAVKKFCGQKRKRDVNAGHGAHALFAII